MTTSYLEAGEVQFVFEFSFSPDEPLSSPPSPPTERETDNPSVPVFFSNRYPYVEVLAYRSDLPQYLFHWAGCLTSNKVVPLDIPIPPINETLSPPEPDNNGCRGTFRLYQNTGTGDRYVWFDLDFGPDYEHVYEGCMVSIPADDLYDPETDFPETP